MDHPSGSVDLTVWRRGPYHNRHACRLHDGRQDNQEAENPPAIFSQPLPPSENNYVGDNAHAFQHHGKGHQEPNRPPHGAEIPVVAMAVFTLREALAGIGERGAALVEAVGVTVGRLESIALWLVGGRRWSRMVVGLPFRYDS